MLLEVSEERGQVREFFWFLSGDFWHFWALLKGGIFFIFPVLLLETLLPGHNGFKSMVRFVWGRL